VVSETVAKTLDMRTGTDRSQAAEVIFLWFGSPLQKSFQSPLVCCQLPPTNAGELLKNTTTKPVSSGEHW
jgi:hypothetical protein